jgi:predicted Zn-dependent protease
LRALGASISAPALAPFVHACSTPSALRGSAPPGAGATARAQPLGAELRQVLREEVAELSQRFVHASALATLRHTGDAVADAGAHGMHHDTAAAVVLQVQSAAGRFEQVSTDISAAGVGRAAQALRARAAAGYQATRPPGPLAKPRDFATTPALDPQKIPPRQWIERVRQLYERSRRVGGSRVVYRGAYLSVDDTTAVFVGNGRDLSQRLVRSRAGVVLVAQRNTDKDAAPVAEVAQQHGLMGLEATDVDAGALDAAAERVLAMVTPVAAPTGDTVLLLAPSMAALFAHQCVAPALNAHAWLSGAALAATLLGQQVGSDQITLVDDSTMATGYGSYFFDDEGRPAALTALIDHGVLKGPIADEHSAAALSADIGTNIATTGNGRRLAPGQPIAPWPSNMTLMPGAQTSEELIAAVDKGLLLDGGLAGHTAARTWRFAARAARGYEIAGGKLTGVLYGDVDIHGEVPAFLRGVAGVSAELERAPWGASSTMAAPYVLTRGQVV